MLFVRSLLLASPKLPRSRVDSDLGPRARDSHRPPRRALRGPGRDKTSLVIFCQSTFEIQTFPNGVVSAAPPIGSRLNHAARACPLMNMETAHNYFLTYYSCCYNFIIVWGLNPRDYKLIWSPWCNYVSALGLEMASLDRRYCTRPPSLSVRLSALCHQSSPTIDQLIPNTSLTITFISNIVSCLIKSYMIVCAFIYNRKCLRWEYIAVRLLLYVFMSKCISS